jgi:hypothetical protein
MARKWISYEMLSMFVGSGDAFAGGSSNADGSYISRLDFIQDYAFSFSVDRQALKQIGSYNFASNQTQLAPDVNLKLSYYLNDGWNEDCLGFNITNTSYTKFLDSEIFSATGDRNFYIAISQDNYKDLNADLTLNGCNILGVGNAYVNSYNLNVGVGGLATVSCDFIAANATISTYGVNNYLPSVDTENTGQTASGANQKYGIAFIDNTNDYDRYVDQYGDLTADWQANFAYLTKYEYGKRHWTLFGQGEGRTIYSISRQNRYINRFKSVFNGGCPFGNVSFTASEAYGGDAMSFGEIFSNIQSFDLSINFERKSLYGFGNNYPFARKLQRPLVGNVSIETLVSGFSEENLAETFSKEDVSISGYNFNVIFKNNANVSKLGLRISGAKLDSYQIGAQINGQSAVSTSWSFPITDGTELLVSGSRPDKSFSAVYTNESLT